MTNKITGVVLLFSSLMFAQQPEKELPYYELPEASEKYTAGTVAARQVDALGFRFFWSSEGLTEKDLAYKPTDSVRTSLETIIHIYDLSCIIVNAALKKSNTKNDKPIENVFELRKQTLLNLKQAAAIFRVSADISQYKLIFGAKEMPFWNAINGPISDAIWHCGQLASFRRVAGNPINPKVNHFNGTVRK